MSEGRFATFLAESFAVLRRELPQAHRAMCRCLARREALLRVDGEVLGVRFTSHRAVLAPPQRPAVTVVTSRAAILALVDAETTLVDAVLDDRLELRGAPAAVLAFHDGLAAYLHGAMRAPSFPRLLAAYRARPPGEEP